MRDVKALSRTMNSSKGMADRDLGLHELCPGVAVLPIDAPYCHMEHNRIHLSKLNLYIIQHLARPMRDGSLKSMPKYR